MSFLKKLINQNSMRQAIILAGGLGTRLQGVVSHCPKPMAPIKDRPFLFYLLSHLKKNRFTDVVISVCHLKEQIMEYFGDSFLGMKISYSIEDKPLGTGGAIKKSLSFVNYDEPVSVLNGDTFMEVDYDKLLESHLQGEGFVSIALRNIENSSRYGFVEINESNMVCSFQEKSKKPRSGLINGGIYVLDPSIFSNYSLGNKFSFEDDFLVKFVKDLQIKPFISDGYFIDIGVPEDYRKSQNEIPKKAQNKALFLDRDGVINIDHGYVHKIEDFDFIDGIFELCKKAQDNGYLICIVTNQAGIGKGYYSREQFEALTIWMESQFEKQEITISRTYFCPYHVEAKIAKFKKDSYERKPKPGMILRAIEDFNIDPSKSLLIGDNETDIQAGESAKLGKTLLFKGYNHQDTIKKMSSFCKFLQ